jgi:PAS domain S-box-containing protein
MLRAAKHALTRYWGNFSLRNKGVVFLLLPVGALLLNSALIYHFAAQRERDQFWVIHTFQVQLKLQEILASLSAVVVDCRTYRLTRDRVTLDEARKGANSVLAEINAVAALTKDNPKQQQRIPNLRMLAGQRLKYLLDRAIAEERVSTPKEIQSQADHRVILGLIERMEQEEAALLTGRTETSTQTQDLAVATGGITFLIGLACGASGIWLFLSGVSRRITAVGKQVALLAEGIAVENTDPYRDEIALVFAGLQQTSGLLIERDLAIQASNAMVKETAERGDRRFQSLVNATAQIVWITDSDGRVHAGSQLHGPADASFDAFARDDWRESIHPQDRAAVQTLWAEALADKKAYECEFRLQTADGSYREFHLRGVPVLEQDARIREWIWTANDVSEANRGAATRRRLAAIVESSDDAIFSIAMDDSITSWNKGAENIFGYSAEEVLGRDVRLLTPGGADDMDLDRRCVATGVAIKNRDVSRRHKNGSLITVALTLSPLYDETGKIAGVSKVARDVTAQRHAEELLQQQANLLEQAYEPMIAWEPGGLIVYWNRGAEDLYGFSSQHAVGRNIHQLLQTRHTISLSEREQQLATQQLWIGELDHMTKDGQTITVESRQKRLGLAKRPVVGVGEQSRYHATQTSGNCHASDERNAGSACFRADPSVVGSERRIRGILLFCLA